MADGLYDSANPTSSLRHLTLFLDGRKKWSNSKTFHSDKRRTERIIHVWPLLIDAVKMIGKNSSLLSLTIDSNCFVEPIFQMYHDSYFEARCNQVWKELIISLKNNTTLQSLSLPVNPRRFPSPNTIHYDEMLNVLQNTNNYSLKQIVVSPTLAKIAVKETKGCRINRIGDSVSLLDVPSFLDRHLEMNRRGRMLLARSIETSNANSSTTDLNVSGAVTALSTSSGDNHGEMASHPCDRILETTTTLISTNHWVKLFLTPGANESYDFHWFYLVSRNNPAILGWIHNYLSNNKSSKQEKEPSTSAISTTTVRDEGDDTKMPSLDLQMKRKRET